MEESRAGMYCKEKEHWTGGWDLGIKLALLFTSWVPLKVKI